MLCGTGTEALRPGIDVSPLTVDFGSVALGLSSTSDVTVSNTGTAVLHINNITISDGQFSLDSANIFGTDLGAGASTTITLRFTPASVGAQSGTMTFTSNDPDEGTVNVSLSGTGTAVSAPQINVVPTTIDFGSVYPGLTSPVQVVTITNTGNANLVMGNISLGGLDPGHFEIVSDNASGRTMAPGDSANVSVQFSPLTSGDKSSDLVVPSNDPDEPAAYVHLSGFAIPGTPNVQVVPRNIYFGSLTVGTTSSPRTVTILNIGTADLDFGNVYIGGPDAGQFAIDSDNASGMTLAPWDFTTVSVTFSPSTPYTKIAGLYIPTNDPS